MGLRVSDSAVLGILEVFKIHGRILGLEGVAAYHLDFALTAVVDGCPAVVAVVDSQNSKSLSICVPLTYLGTSRS